MIAEPLSLARSSSRHDSEPGTIHRQIPHAEKTGSGMLDRITKLFVSSYTSPLPLALYLKKRVESDRAQLRPGRTTAKDILS